MKHEKQTDTAGSVRTFLRANAEDLIFGLLFSVGFLIGLFLPSGQAGAFLLFAGEKTAAGLILSTLGSLAFFYFAAFFCGTSPLGLVAPLTLLAFGLISGESSRLFAGTNIYGYYLLFLCPVILLSALFLIRQLKFGLSLSFRLFRLCTGGSVADVPIRFRLFLKHCLIGFFIVVAVCLLLEGLFITFSAV